MSRRSLVGVYVTPGVDRRMAHLAIDVGKAKSELYELGARLILALVEAGNPENCLAVLDPETREQLKAVLVKAREVAQ